MPRFKNERYSKRQLSWYLWPLPALAAFAAQRLLAARPGLVETVHSQRLFRTLAGPLSTVTSLVPFSLTEAAVVLGAPLLLVLLVIWLIRCSASAQGPFRSTTAA